MKKLLDRFFLEADKKQALSWSFYDFANSAYALLIASFVFPIFFREVIAGGGKFGDFYWGLIISISILAGGLLAPIVGAMADYDGRKKQRFMMFALFSIGGTGLLYFTGSGTLLFASLIFIASNLTLEIATTLYDSLLARVSTKETVGRISGLAWGLGYLGGTFAMLLLKPFYGQGYSGELEPWYRLTFPLTALFFLVFALPSFLYIKEEVLPKAKERLSVLLKIGLSRAWQSIKNFRQHKNIAWFLLGFYFLNDALVTLFAFVPIYGRITLAMSFEEIVRLLLIVQLVGFPSATIFGFLADRRGPKKILLFTIAVWSIIVILIAGARTKPVFYLIALLAALVIGASQAVARSWLSTLVPEEKRFEFFGFNAFASKIAATTGPVIFGLVSALTSSQRLAFLSLLPYLLIAFIIFARLKEQPAR